MQSPTFSGPDSPTSKSAKKVTDPYLFERLAQPSQRGEFLSSHSQAILQKMLIQKKEDMTFKPKINKKSEEIVKGQN